MVDRTKLEALILALVATLPGGAGRSVTPAMSLRTDLGLDSLAIVSLLARVAEELDVDPEELIEAISFEQMNTLGDVIALGEKLTQGAGP